MPDLVEYVCITGLCDSNFEKTGCESRDDLFLEKKLQPSIKHKAGVYEFVYEFVYEYVCVCVCVCVCVWSDT
jgi:hypothetical protein